MISADIWWDGRWWDGPGIVWAILGMVASAAVWIILFAVIIMMVKRRPVSLRSHPSAIRILEERYARGEISREEFVERRGVLTGRRSDESSSTPASPPPAM